MKPSSNQPFAEVTVGEHRLALLRDGAQAYPAMLEAIGEAKSTVCLETYILRDDRTGRRFAKALAERAQAGVEVSVLYDAWGSSVSSDYIGRLRKNGVRLVAYGPGALRGKLGGILARLRRRDHRKLLVVDGVVGFTGGINIADDYAPTEAGGRGWRDTQVRIRGPAAASLQASFMATWRDSNGPPMADEHDMQLQGTDGRVRVIGNEFRRDRKNIRRAYMAAIVGARKRIHVTNAYFLPPVRLLRALSRAARRGVDVSVILPATTDVKLVLLAVRGLYGKLLRAGVRVFEWRGRVLHAKTAVVDGRWATVGSANLDHLSLRDTLETNAVVEDEAFAAAVEAMFAQDLYECDEMTLDWWKSRPPSEKLLSRLAYRLRSWL